jgi:hypothetical protein
MDVLSASYPGQSCAGCNAVEGKIFWTQYMNLDTCPIYQCCRNEKQLTHCGECAALPCQIYFATKDPALSEEAHKKSIQDRVDALRSL